MARGRQQAEWERTGLLAAIGANPYRCPKQRPFTPDDFNPFAEALPRPNKTTIKIKVDCLKALCKEDKRR